MGGSPRVTVVIPVYNSEKYLADAIDSILAQTFEDFEVILIDDGSTDGSVEIMAAHTDLRIRLAFNEANMGIANTRNRGIELARGEYLAVLDHDDSAYSDRFSKQVAFLDRHRDHAAVGSWAEAMDEEGRILKRIKRQPVSPGEIQWGLLFECCLLHSSIMARTAVLRECGYRAEYAVCQDYDLFVRLAGRHKLANLPEVLARYRKHAGGFSRRNTELEKADHLEIFRAQLAALGVSFTDIDLERHFLLTRRPNLRFVPDREYLDWAESWLLKLRDANRLTLRYPEEPFLRVAGEKWLKTCRRAAAGGGWKAWERFRRSPLSEGHRGEAWKIGFRAVYGGPFRRRAQE